MKILITGGAGFIGYHLAKKLARSSENKITIADNLHRNLSDKELKELVVKPNVVFEKVDLTDLASMKPIWKHYDEVYHLAAIIGVEYCINHPSTVLHVNILSIMNVIKLIIENKCQKLVFTSTSETYAGGLEFGIIEVPTSESVPLVISDIREPRFSYAGSKIVGEQLVMFNAKGNYNYSTIRYHNIYGPRMGYAHVIPKIIKRLYLNERPLVCGNHTRAFCFVEDAVNQTIAVMKKGNNEIFHIGNNDEIYIKDLVKKIIKIYGSKLKPKNISTEPGSVERRCPDISKVKSLGVYPKIDLNKGLKKTINWYKKESLCKL